MNHAQQTSYLMLLIFAKHNPCLWAFFFINNMFESKGLLLWKLKRNTFPTHEQFPCCTMTDQEQFEYAENNKAFHIYIILLYGPPESFLPCLFWGDWLLNKTIWLTPITLHALLWCGIIQFVPIFKSFLAFCHHIEGLIHHKNIYM